MLSHLYWDNLCYVKLEYCTRPSNKIIVHIYTDFAIRPLKQTWLFTYPYGFCNPVRIHGMKINDDDDENFRILNGCVRTLEYWMVVWEF